MTWTQIWQKMKMGFLESERRGGSEKSSFAMYLVNIDHYQCCQLSPFPEPPPPQLWGALLNAPPPPPEMKTRLPLQGQPYLIMGPVH